MSNIQNANSDNLVAYTTAGVQVAPDRNNATAANRGLTLAPGTYYIPLDSMDETLVHVKMRWNAAFAATITVESTSYPAAGRDNVTDVTDWSTNAGDWDQENPSTAYVPAGTGYTVTNLTIVVGGTAAGGTGVHLGNMGCKRLRLKLIVTVAGIIRVANNAKRPSVG